LSFFFMFQMTFAIITPALIVGAYPERTSFLGMLLFSVFWLLVAEGSRERAPRRTIRDMS
jgi:ammonia channel protein AmtB